MNQKTLDDIPAFPDERWAVVCLSLMKKSLGWHPGGDSEREKGGALGAEGIVDLRGDMGGQGPWVGRGRWERGVG